VPALIDRYHQVSDQSRKLFHLLECLGYVATAYGDAFAPFVPPLFHRCIKVIHGNLQESVAAVNNEGLEEPDKDFLITSLDLSPAECYHPGHRSGEERSAGGERRTPIF
jgi:hypothetical protein